MNKIHWFQISLFCITFVTTTLAGAEWIYGRYFFLNESGMGWNEWLDFDKLVFSLNFSIPFLLILTVHEFGHYFTAKFYQIRVTLPYYIPFWLGISSSIGTMGAFIKIKQAIHSKKIFFDVGVAGPVAGFLVALAFLIYGFTHLPPAEYIFSIHPEYAQYGLEYSKYVYSPREGNFYLGKNLLFWILENTIADKAKVPNAYEMMHYPYLFAGFLSCFFTALNLMPIGQLDGGHIIYGLFGHSKHRIISIVLYLVFVFYSGLGLVSPAHFVTDEIWIPAFYFLFLHTIFIKIFEDYKTSFLASFAVFTLQIGLTFFFPSLKGYSGWLLFAFILGRFLGISHPKCEDESSLNVYRKILGIVSLIIFILCFSPTPFVFE